MTEQDFKNRSFKAFMLLIYKTERMIRPVECLLCEIDFDNKIFKLYPIPGTKFFENGCIIDSDFVASYENVTFPPKQPTST